MKKLTLLASILCALSLSAIACDDDKDNGGSTVENDDKKDDTTGGETGGKDDTTGGETGGKDDTTGGETGGKDDTTGGETGGKDDTTGGETGGKDDTTGGETGGKDDTTGGETGGETSTCNLTDAPVCSDDNTIMTCTDVYFTDGEDYIPTKVYTHCLVGSSCKDGKCVLDEGVACAVDSCKDLHTLNSCKGGKITEVDCGADSLCIADKCSPYNDVKTCSKASDCGDNQNCHDGLCYDNANMDLKEGDACNSATFQEYCDGDKEVKCGYDDTVEVFDCAPYNGCAMRVQKAYSREYAIRNAACRGDSDKLALCTHAGVLGNMCVNNEFPDMPEFNMYYSVTNACEYGTDGSMMYVEAREQTRCSSKCIESTGFCPE